MSDLDSIFQTLLDKGYAEDLFGAGRPDGRHNRKVDCPLCKGNDLSYNLVTPQWHCWNCGAGGNWITYLTQTQGVGGWEAVQVLAKSAGIDWKPSKAEERRVELEAVREAYWQLCIAEAAKKGARARAVFNHLVQRGYTPTNLPASAGTLNGIAVAPDPETVRAGLEARNFDLKQIKAAGLIYNDGTIAGWGGYQLVMRWETRGGRINGFIWRDVWGTADAKYLYSAGLARNEGLVGLAVAGQLIRKAAAMGRRVGLLLVEGVLDAVCLNDAGIPTAALGGVDISLDQINKMSAVGVPFVFLALDADKVGQGNILKVARVFQQHKIECYIWQVPDYRGCKDSEELFLQHGVDAIALANANALPAGHWVAAHTVKQYPDASTHPQAERELIRAARDALGGLRLAEDRQAFLSEITRLSRLDPGILTAGIAELDAATAREAQAATARTALTAALTVLKEGATPDTIKQAAGAVRAAGTALLASSAVELPPRYDLGQWISDLARKPEGLPVFWSDYLLIPTGAITVISGGTGGGKTTLMLNLLWHWLDSTSDRYVFLSYEERREDLLLKLVMAGAGVVIESERNTQRVREYIIHGGEAVATTPDVITKLDGALDKLDRWLTDGRLDVTDVPYQAEQLPALIASLNAYPPRAILLDYIQKIPLEGRGAARYLDLQAVSATLLGIAIEHNVALVIGSQLNADGLTREARDISFDASLMIRLKPVEVEKGQPDFPPNATEMDAIIDKNRQGWQGKFLLVWDKPSRRMARKLFDKSRVSSGLK